MLVPSLDLPIQKVEQQLLYIVYGNDLNYQIETKLNILSILRNTKSLHFTIRIVTDQPAEYEGWPVEIIPLSQQILQDWLGNTHYHYRRKLLGLLTLLPYAERTVFLDTDTTVQGNANDLFAFSDNQVLVDSIDGVWLERKNDTLIAKVSQYLLDKYAQYDVSTLLINSGVLGFTKANIGIIEEAIHLLDELWPVDNDCRVLEQFCLAISINKQKAIIEQKFIYHYWSRKEFFQQMGRYFFDKYGYTYQETLPEKSKEIPCQIIRPSSLSRLLFRLNVKRFPKKQQSGLLKLLYALALEDIGYEGKQKIAYWQQAMTRGFLRYNPEAYQQFKSGHWPRDYKKITSNEKQQKFLDFLKREGLLE